MFACGNKASAFVQTLHGWYYMCSFCLMNGHMLVNVRVGGKKPLDKYDTQKVCECEHLSHQ